MDRSKVLGWYTVWWHGAAHRIPIGDKRMHTMPWCWCLPHRGRKLDAAPTSELYFVHNALLEE